MPLSVISAPPGTGKTSFAAASHASLARAALSDRSLDVGSLILTHEREKADEIYRTLAPLIPGQVMVWTRDHDIHCKKPERVLCPAVRSTPEQLEKHFVAIVTTYFYKEKRGHLARHFINQNGERQTRTLITIDEQPADVKDYLSTLTQASQVKDAVEQFGNSDAIRAMHALVLYMTTMDCTENAPALEVPKDVADEIRWFGTPAAKVFLETYGDLASDMTDVFNFARAMVNWRAFIYRRGKSTRFVGYESTLKLHRPAVLLDATGNIDGLTNLCPLWRLPIQTPTPNYANLTIVHVDPQRRPIKSLAKYLEGPKERQAYVAEMVDTIKANMAPGQRGLVVCKKDLVSKYRSVPTWPTQTIDNKQLYDPRFDDPASYQERYEWEIEGRKLCVTTWGTGVGFNTWKDADVVFLFDEFHLPKSAAVAQTQGHLRAKAFQGPLAKMRNLNSKSRLVETFSEGHLKRQLVQMALRGRARHFDKHGVCGKQKLVFVGDYQRLLGLFPGATLPPYTPAVSDTQRRAHKLIGLLSRLGSATTHGEVTTAELDRELGVPWRSCSKKLLAHPGVQAVQCEFGLKYVPGRKGNPSRFQKRCHFGIAVPSVGLGLYAAAAMAGP